MKRKHFGFLILIPFLFVGCGDSKVKKLGEGGGASTEVKVDDAAFFIKAKKSSTSLNPNSAYLIHKLEGGIGVDSSWVNDSCKLSTAELSSGTQDIICIVEVPELDLYVSGLNLTYNVPGGACDHFTASYYHYFNLPAGRVTNSVASACGIAPTCAYDYTLSEGPDCCEGTWTDAAACAAATPASVGGVHLYTGKISNCLAGSGFDSAIGKNQKGYPQSTIYDTSSSEGRIESVDFKSPMDKEAVSNVYIANYYNPNDHTTATNNENADLGVNAPIAFQRAVNSAYDPEPFYKFICYDAAGEIKGRIRVMVRDWNKKTVSRGGSSDDSGSESDFPSLINDFWDWKDFNATYPAESLKP